MNLSNTGYVPELLFYDDGNSSEREMEYVNIL